METQKKMELQHFSHKHPLIYTQEQSHESEDDDDQYGSMSGEEQSHESEDEDDDDDDEYGSMCGEEQSNESKDDDDRYCSMCGEEVSGPCFSCIECGYHLDEKCANAPTVMNHPFHRNHSLKLQTMSQSNDKGQSVCTVCNEGCEKFFYQCSSCSDLALHIKCAMFSYEIAGKRIGDDHCEELESADEFDGADEGENAEHLKKAKCFVCCNRLLGSSYIAGCDFYLHKKCDGLPLEIKHSFHLQHSLYLQFNTQNLPCNICQETQTGGFVYCCSLCNFSLHIDCPNKTPDQINHPCHPKHPFIRANLIRERDMRCGTCQEASPRDQLYVCSICELALHSKCISPPTVIENNIHEHPFTICLRQRPFICDACGTRGNCISYICMICGFMVHKNCTSLPPSLDLPRHQHCIHHNYFLEENEFKMKKCRLCNVQVDTRYGSYCCRSCNYICHVKCAIEDYDWYGYGWSSEELKPLDPSYVVISKTEIKHFSHQHKLVLGEDNVGRKLCAGCVLLISSPYYHCTECDFFLHKSCAELPRKKKLWFHAHQFYLILISDSFFRCAVCRYECSGFAYKCGVSSCGKTCLRCALVDSQITSKCHEHQLWFFEGKEGKCNACGVVSKVEYWCEYDHCDFVVHDKCLKLPQIAWHKCDEHLLKLVCHKDIDYVEHNYCDICEETRNPNLWFYNCEICDKAAHPKCVLGKYPFIKPWISYNSAEDDHPLQKDEHPHRHFIFVPTVYEYPECHKCRKHCDDLALACAETGCNYIVHWECIKTSGRSRFKYRFMEPSDNDL